MKTYEQISGIVLGILYAGTGMAILRWPELLYYGVAAIFVIHGLIIITRMILHGTKE